MRHTQRTVLLSILLVWACLLLIAPQVYAGGYSYSRTVTIDHTKVPTTDQSNFPVLFSGTYAYLKTTANGGNVTNANGYDIIFTSDAAGLTKLDHEIETYTATTGAVNFWVRVPTVSHTSDTVIYLWYGNAAITTSQENKTGVWDASYKGVWHLPNGTTLTANDSTSNAANGTLNGAPAAGTGYIDGGGVFNGAGDYITGSLTSGNTNTVSCWFKPSSLPTTSSNEMAFFATGGAEAFIRNTSGTTNIAVWGSAYVQGTTVLANSTWYYIVVTRNGTTSNGYKAYLNGGLEITTTRSSDDSGPTTFYIARKSDGTAQWPGTLDECRYSNIVRAADWITTEYNNQNSPSTFYTVGSEQGMTGFFRRRLQ